MLQVLPMRNTGSLEPLVLFMICTKKQISMLNILFVLLGPPSAPTGPVHLTSITNNSVTFDWQPPKDDGGSPVSAYRLFLCEEGSDWSELSTLEMHDKEYTAKNLAEGKTYVFHITAVNEVGDSKPLDSDKVTPKKLAGKIKKCSICTLK